MKPTSMLYRNLMAMDVEESIRAYPLDAVVLLAGCDKSIPAELMGAASAGVPAIMVTGGPCAPAHFRGRELGVGTDIWHYTDDVRAGRMTLDEYDQLEAAIIPSYGHCSEMGTASTMSCHRRDARDDPPRDGDDPGVDARRRHAAEALRPPRRRDRDGGPAARRRCSPSVAFDNAITVLMALGGSTNAVVHLLALARRVGIDLHARPLRRALAPHAGARERAARPASTCSSISTGRAASPRCSRSWRRSSTSTCRTVAGGTLGDQIADAR